MRTTIQISEKVRKKLRLLAACKDTNYEKLLDEFTN